MFRIAIVSLLFVAPVLSTPPIATPECMKSVRFAYAVGVHIHDVDSNGIIDAIDIAPAALQYGMYWADINPRDGQLSREEVQTVYDAVMSDRIKFAPLRLAAKGAIAVSSLFTTKYTADTVFQDCDANNDGFITREDYDNSRATCIETCGKTEDVFDYLGSKFGKIH